MNDNYFFSNNSFEENDDYENNSLFFMNQNQQILPFLNLDNNIHSTSNQNNDNFSINLDNNSIQLKDTSLKENNFNKDFSQISPIPPQNEDESYKQQMQSSNNSNNSNNNINNYLLNNSNSNSSSTKDKSQVKNILNNNNIINENNSQLMFDDYINNKEKNQIDINNIKKEEKEEKVIIAKKRKPRVHLEDLDIDPELIKNKKFQKIGDKVILSKNQIITEDDKKEIRAIRNRISAQKSRDRKKAEYIIIQEKLKYLTNELDKKIKFIQNLEKICCSQCKSKMIELNNKLLEDTDVNNIFISSENKEKENENENEGLVLEEDNSSISGKRNSFIGKISGVLVGLICLVGIVLCIFEGNNNYSKTNFILSDQEQKTLRHLSENTCPNNNLNESYNIIDGKNNITNNNLPLPIESLNKNNFLQMCHDKFTWEIYSNSKKKNEKKTGNLMKKNYNKDSIIDNPFCIETKNIINNNYIINNSSDINNLPIGANNILLNNKISNKIISVFVKDYQALKRYENGKCLSLQEQIEIESKKSEDGCVYLQMIIPRESIKSSFDKNDSYSEYENNFFEIRCKVFAYNNYYDGVASH